ncbi:MULTISPECIES: hypothetical protein [Calditerrivibrio]|uniref:hypothetical protein n=1 Tax=Calditerrivibrio TaxID=545865 RepID=UPI003C71DD4C
MIKFLKTVFLLYIAISIMGCGKKLDPKPKDSIIIPAPQNVILKNTDDGIYIKNNEKYVLFIEKSSIDDLRCAEDFKFLIKLKPEEEFVDKNVIESHSYVYRFTNMDENIGVESIFRPKSILFSRPISIKSFVIMPNPNGEALISLQFDRVPRGFIVKLNGKDLGRFSGDNVTILLEEKEQNEIVIIPYDQYNNTGVEKKIIFSNPKIYFLTPPEKIKFIRDEDKIFLSWEAVPYAKGYRIYDNESNLIIDTKVNYAKIVSSKCINFYISSYNDVTESDKKLYKNCE